MGLFFFIYILEMRKPFPEALQKCSLYMWLAKIVLHVHAQTNHWRG